VVSRLLVGLPDGEPASLYELVAEYPSRPAKGIRPALCLSVCRALGGDAARALDSAIAVELFHNAFLIHDDVQDESERRRGGPTLHAEHGVGVALNVGNMTNLLALRRLFENRWRLGADASWRIVQETELMMRHTLEGQALELGWIRDNACDLAESDYLRMCLKKTSWYTCLYPCRIGAIVAGAEHATPELDRYGWFLGAAFQIQDDVLNLAGDEDAYGKEIGGDLREGKRTLMLIDVLRTLRGAERQRVVRFLALPRAERGEGDVAWLHERIVETGALDRASALARQLAAAARDRGEAALADVPDSAAREFLLALPAYVVERDR
jgi:geranylgeranyl diphosphate synthase, type II